MLRGLANWWDSVELWVTQLAFPWQVVLAIVVLLPLCAGVAVVVDRCSDLLDHVVDAVAARRGPRSDRPEA